MTPHGRTRESREGGWDCVYAGIFSHALFAWKDAQRGREREMRIQSSGLCFVSSSHDCLSALLSAKFVNLNVINPCFFISKSIGKAVCVLFFLVF